MRATGIVRRVDDLGRIVIPKEIRRTLKIREGAPLEVFTDREGSVILRKYSPVGEMGNDAAACAEALHKTVGCLTLVCDRDTVVAAAGSGRRGYMEKPVSAAVDQWMANRSTVQADTRTAAVPAPLIQGEEAQGYTAQTAVPVISAGETVGIVILASREANARMGEAELKCAQAAAAFLGRQAEV